MRWLVLPLLLIFLWSPGLAEAARVDQTFETSTDITVPGRAAVAYQGSPEEVNRLSVVATATETVLRDEAGLQAGPGCEAVSPLEVVCRAASVQPEIRTVRVDLGDADDQAKVEGPGVAVEGGFGADQLVGSRESDDLAGGPGSDTLDGGDGNDHFPVSDADVSNDRIIGGSGLDRLDFSAARQPIEIQLNVPFGVGRLGSAALLVDEVEIVEGTAFGDMITGTMNGDRLLGGEGDDLLVGQAGDDAIVGGPGRDRVDAGAGDDLIEDRKDDDRDALPDRGGNDYGCGVGADTILRLRRDDVVGAGCERFGGFRRIRSSLTLPRYGCRRCRERLTVRAESGRVLLRRGYRREATTRRPTRRVLLPAAARGRVLVELRSGSRRLRVLARFTIDPRG